MRRLQWLVAGALLPGLIAVASPGSAAAAESLDARITPSVKWPGREVVLSLPTKRVLAPGEVRIEENGRPVGGVRVTSAADSRRRGVVLVIDTSLTMRGEPIREAIIAARSFARRRAANAPLGVVFFAGEPRVALAPTTDAAKIKATLAVGPAISRGTRIFDAAAAGVDLLGRAGLSSGAVIVLSDGAEAINGSRTTPQALAEAAEARGARIFSVGLDSASFDPAALQSMASATGGRYGQAARPKDLPPLFAAIGERLSSEYIVNYKSRVSLGERVDLRAQVDGIARPATVSYTAPKMAFAPVGPGRAATNGGLGTAGIALIASVGFLLLTLVLYLVLRPAQRTVVSRVAEFAGGPRPTGPTMEDVRRFDAEQAREPSARWQRYTEAVELSGIGLTPAAVALWTATATVGAAAWFAVGLDRPQLIVFALAIPFVARAVVRSRLKARRRQFEDQLPDNLQVLASAMRAGYSFTAAMTAMAEDAPEPSRTELQRASNDEQLGVDILDSLRAVGTRMDNPEIEYVGIVAKMQRESGGNTAEILDQVIVTIRERQRIKRMVQTLTAQSRLGGAVISSMPLVVVFGMSITNPGYFDPMFESGVGLGLMFAGAAMLATGWLLIRKIVDIGT